MKRSTLLNIILACVLVGSIVAVNATHIPMNIITGPAQLPEVDEYDPFYDVSSEERGYPDGKIDMRDVGAIARQFGTQGNSSRNVTITNYVNGGIPYGCCQEPGIYKEIMEITVLDWSSMLSGAGAYDVGVQLKSHHLRAFLPFDFSPKGTLLNITDFWIIITDSCHPGMTIYYDITINDNTTVTTTPRGASGDFWALGINSIQLGEELVNDLIYPGINTLEFWNVQGSGNYVVLYRITILIEYEYEIQ
jgi:hypothetical protein